MSFHVDALFITAKIMFQLFQQPENASGKKILNFNVLTRNGNLK